MSPTTQSAQEAAISFLENKGFIHIFPWRDEPNAVYPEHSHRGNVSLCILDGSVTFHGELQKTLTAGDQFDVPGATKHSAVVGPEGCEYVVGEEIEGDS